ncbi:hypothetical protein ACLHZ0_05625, partial [Aeromonas salmonicida]|uniref:hypothetical protein n=1 Tax=Aeromonas salmonicida TaxID=645 RepID=UPI003CFE85CB
LGEGLEAVGGVDAARRVWPEVLGPVASAAEEVAAVASAVAAAVLVAVVPPVVGNRNKETDHDF